MKDSGQLVVIPIDQLAAGPAGAMPGSGKQAATSPPAEVPSSSAAPDSSPATVASGAAPSPAPSQAPRNPALASSGERGRSVDRQTAAEDSQEQYAGADEGSEQTEVKGPHAQSAANAMVGSVLASGPGYSIKASGPKGGPARQSPALVAQGAPERLHEPIICQGSRLLHIDNRNLEFDGDAITAEDGCEIHITNTHISAKGIGVLVRAANVHIKNSEIDGGSGAVDASDGAQVYAESSRFKGLTRRLESSAFHDLGGNVWN
jgi:hypothetical protein